MNMKKRSALVKRKTKETDIQMKLTLEGGGKYKIKTPIPFMNHMLELFSKHGLFDLEIKATGDVDVDDHHLAEDLGLALGEAFLKALKNKKGINRYGFTQVPMDEALVTATVDISNRPHLVYDSPVKKGKIKTFDIELVTHFLESFVQSARINLHLSVIRGKNKHHIIEALFKAMARAMYEATFINPYRKDIPSTKGTL